MRFDTNGDQKGPIKRRVFFGKIARKAVYVAPAALALKVAQKTYAGPSGCGLTGSPCNVDPDCCGGFSCLRPIIMAACAGAGDCKCE